jgi:2-hydroxy-3-oxopropionate reductase
MTDIAFIGLGVMGAPMARNLLKAGFTVHGFNRSAQAMRDFVAAGGQSAGGVGEAVSDADVVITMLPDSPDVESVMYGDDGILATAKRGALLVDMSTIRPEVSRQLSQDALARGLGCLDAPVSGGEQAAIDGTLSAMVGGAAEDVQRASPVLAAVAGTVVHVGPAGAGQTVKAANQLIVAGTIELVAEAFVFLRAQGVDIAAGVEVLSAGLAGSAILSRKAPGMINREFRPGFRVDLHHKDLGIFLDAARRVGSAAPLGGLVAALMSSLRAQGGGGLDHTALLLQAERLSGIGSPNLNPRATGDV